VQLRGVAGNSDRAVELMLYMHCDTPCSYGVSRKYYVFCVQERSSSLVFLFSVFLQPVNAVNSPVVPTGHDHVGRELIHRRLHGDGGPRHGAPELGRHGTRAGRGAQAVGAERMHHGEPPELAPQRL
jgi:hypothetical protein